MNLEENKSCLIEDNDTEIRMFNRSHLTDVPTYAELAKQLEVADKLLEDARKATGDGARYVGHVELRDVLARIPKIA